MSVEYLRFEAVQWSPHGQLAADPSAALETIQQAVDTDKASEEGRHLLACDQLDQEALDSVQGTGNTAADREAHSAEHLPYSCCSVVVDGRNDCHHTVVVNETVDEWCNCVRNYVTAVAAGMETNDSENC